MTTSAKFALPVLGLLVAALASPAHAAPPRYRLTVLAPVSGHTESYAVAINAKGQIAANAYTVDPDSGSYTIRPFLWQAGRSTVLRTDAAVYDINFSGLMSGIWEGRGVIFKPNGAVMTIINTGQPNTEPFAINNRGNAAGRTIDYDLSPISTFLYKGGAVTDLGSRGVETVNNINDLDQVAGQCRGKACIYQNGRVRVLTTGVLGSGYGEAFDINQAGQVIGTYDRPGAARRRGFLLSGTVVTDLGNTLPQDIDNDGNIVGLLYGAGTDQSAFIHTGGRTYNLNTLTTNLAGFKLTYARQINGNGQIVGQGNTASGLSRGFLLTPIASSASAD